MSIKSELEKAALYLQEARKAVLGRGGEISLTAGLKDLPEAIFNIPADASLASVVDSSVAYRKTIPTNAEDYALIKKVGGMTYKCNNLITLPYNTTIVSGEEKDGITITINADGSLSVNGKATKTVTRYYVSKMPITAGTYTFSAYGINAFSSVLSLRNKDTTNLFANRASLSGTTPSKTFTVTEEEAQNNYVHINIYIYADTEVNNETIYPMLNVGDTALPYEPYFEGLRDTKVTSIEGVDTLLMPQVVQNKDEYGIGLNSDYYNYIQYRDGRWYLVENVKKVDLGSLEWTKPGRFKSTSLVNEIKYVNDRTSLCLCDAYENYDYYTFYNSYINGVEGFKGISVDDYGAIQVIDRSYPLIGDFKSAMQGKMLIYALAEPIDTDITDLMAGISPLLKVEGDGVVTFHNEHEKAVPSELKYIVKAGT